MKDKLKEKLIKEWRVYCGGEIKHDPIPFLLKALTQARADERKKWDKPIKKDSHLGRTITRCEEIAVADEQAKCKTKMRFLATIVEKETRNKIIKKLEHWNKHSIDPIEDIIAELKL